MKIIFPFIIFFMLLSCSKEDSKDTFIWSKSYGEGEAFSVEAISDSVIIVCGQSEGSPFLVSLDGDHKEKFIINPDLPGSFTSFVADDNGFTLAGCSGTDLLLMRYDDQGEAVWEDTVKTGFNVETARLLSINGGLLAVASPLPDSLGTGDNGFMFVKFDTAGLISSRKRITTPGQYVSAFDAEPGFGGNILLALTLKQATSKSKAAIACYSPLLEKLWEKELFNNPSFSSAALVIARDASGRLFAGGRNEIVSQNITSNNSFVAALDPNGVTSAGWSQKKYPEFINEGRAFMFNAEGNMLYLNRRCFIVNEIDRIDGSDEGIVRPFTACASGSTDAYASGFDIIDENELVFAGSVGNRFFIGIKTLQ